MWVRVPLSSPFKSLNHNIMGMFSEAHASNNAKKLEKIMLDAIEGSDWTFGRSVVRGFAFRNLYTWYVSECDEAFIKPNEKILNEFSK